MIARFACLPLLICTLLFVAEMPAAEVTPTTTIDTRLPGVSLAEGVSQITGTAVSPLLGVSSIGAWKYVTTPEAQRHLLPWYCHPWVWGVSFGILGLCFLKDFLGTAAPPLVKKPLDFIELFEDKASALVASTAFVPLVVSAVAQMDALQPQSTALVPAQMNLAMMPVASVLDMSWMQLALYTPVAIVVFAMVWMTCHAINVLIALSPFGIVDAALKLVKLALLALITGSAFIHPLLGLAVCVPIIVVAAFVAGPAFRLMIFGNVFGWDLLFGRKATAADLKHGVKSFNTCRLGSTPVRTYGEVHVSDSGVMAFRYRPWLVFPPREIALVAALPDGICEGMFYHSLTRPDEHGRVQSAFMLLPRYKDCVTELSTKLGIRNVTDSKLLRGFKAMRNWLVEFLSLGQRSVDTSVSPR